MLTNIAKLALVLSAVSIALACMGGSCDAPVEPADNEQVGGSVPDGEDSGSDDAGNPPADQDDDDSSTPADTNPNSPCADQTNVYVTYVNQSAARVGFVENFRDQSYQVISAKIYVLEPAGHSNATLSKCIACPYQAGIRNVKYIRDGVQSSASYPPDLFVGQFSCGDNITFVFKDNKSITTQVETP